MGSLLAVVDTELITFAATGVVEVLVKDRFIREVSCAYALQFHQCLCESGPPLSVWPTDLFVPHADFCEITSRMGQDLRTSGVVRRIGETKQARDVESSSSMELPVSSDLNVEHPAIP